ncbi:uncharacterized protein METZ01_LOCUS346255 [marine metagenome]|uniref:Uncharacterized protein n=1 Tax=marine metagenome TaxID=408172 RepID=A0A382RA19_9ZZZZ
MSYIDDDGKIWLQGSTRPEYGVRIGDRYFVTGKKDSENSKCFIHEKCLLVDLHDPVKQYRIFHRIPLDLIPKSPGTLFNGFKNTMHADIMATTYKDVGVDKFVLDGRDYLLARDNLIDPTELMQLANWE